MNSLRYKAVVYDLDGTAVNSYYNLEALQRTCVSVLGYPITEEDLKLTYSMTAQNTIRYLGVSESLLPEFYRKWVENITELCQTASLFDGIYEGMVQMKEAGILLGINTSRQNTEMGDLTAYIKQPFLQICSQIVTCDLVERPKPAPDSLLYFCKQTNLLPSEVLFVGDSEFDSTCAFEAGCDFALAVWGCFYPEKIKATYRPRRPDELLQIVGLNPTKS